MTFEDFFVWAWLFFYLLLGFVLIGSLIYFGILEYRDWQDTKKLIRDNNGTCIDKGYSVECSYSQKYSVVNSNSRCYKNDVEINCSEIGK